MTREQLEYLKAHGAKVTPISDKEAARLRAEIVAAYADRRKRRQAIIDKLKADNGVAP